MGSTGLVARGRALAATPAGKLVLLVLGGMLAAAVVPFWILLEAGETEASRRFVSSPQFVVWVLILCGQAAFWVGAAAYVLVTVRRQVRDLRRRNALPRAAIVAFAAAAIVVVAVTILLLFGSRAGVLPEFTGPRGIPLGEHWPLYRHDPKVLPFVATAMLIAFIAIAGMWLTALGFADLTRRARPRRNFVRRFVALRSELTTLLAVVAALIGIATLSSGALREAVLAENPLPVSRDAAVACLATSSGEKETAARSRFDELADTFPECLTWQFDRRYVLAYGLLFTGVLALAFAPSFLAMRRAGERLRELSYPLPDPTDPTFFAAVEQRGQFDALLQTNLSGSVAFKAAAAIFTPLAASLLSTLVPT